MPAPEFVVVEEVDAAVYSRGEDGRLLTRETAQALADSLAGGGGQVCLALRSTG